MRQADKDSLPQFFSHYNKPIGCGKGSNSLRYLMGKGCLSLNTPSNRAYISHFMRILPLC